MQLLKILVIITLSLCIGGCKVLKSIQESMLFFPQKLSSDYQYNYPQAFEEKFVAVAPNVKLNALHFRAQNPKGVLLYFHGNAGSLASWGAVAGDFLPMGYDVFIFDYRGYGKSQGKIGSEEELYKDAQALFDYLKKEYTEDQIILYGRSIGTGMATYLAAATSAKMLILETPFYNLVDLAKHHYPIIPRSWVTYKFPNADRFEEIKMPIFMIHGTRDQIIPYDDSVKLKKLRNDVQLFTVQGGGHNNLSDFPEFRNAIQKILAAPTGE